MNLTKDHLVGAGVGAGAALIVSGSIIGIAKLIKKHKEKKIAEQVVALQKATATALANK